MSVVNKAQLLNLRVGKFDNDGAPIDASDAATPMQPALSTRFDSGPFYPQMWEGVHGQANIKALGEGTSPAFLFSGTPAGAYFIGSAGPVRLVGRGWQQDDVANPGVGVWFYSLPIPWPHIKATGGLGGGEFGYFYLGLDGADNSVGNEPELEISLVGSDGNVFGDHTFQPSTTTGQLQLVQKVPLNTSDFFPSWPEYGGLDLTGEILGLRVKLTASSGSGQPWKVILGRAVIFFSYVPSAKQESGW